MRPDRWQRIDQLYNAALELREVQRAAYLQQACAGDDALRQEVESLLAQGTRSEGFLETPALEMAARKMAERQIRSLVGQQPGSYKIVSLLGAGGMGEVYQAHDTKLGRDVAIKVLPAAFVHDPERLARFQQEARMLASLNHPNIATIHGLEQSDGVNYLVMELVAGQTLAERISAGPVAVEETLRICGQIAEALEAAHEKGVVHRDLKPANVKVTPEGRVKVLDFGLAKAFAGDGGQDLSHAPTLTETVSEEGKILGTPAYMSPEQARGKPVDKRTDIWAFGCVLYELLTGKQVFGSETVSDTIASVLEKEPSWQALPASTPEKIRDLLRRCLRKDLRRRLHDAADARIEIEETLATPLVAEPAAAVKGIRILGRRELLFGAGALLLVAVIASLLTWNLKPPSPQPVTRTVINLPPGQQLAGLESGPAVALSPDGSHLAYVARQDGVQQLYFRAMDSQQGKPIPGTEGAVSPFFSPDGQWLGFFEGGSLKKVSVAGGAAQTLANVALPRGASWSSQGIVAFAPSTNGALLQVPEAGGTPQALTRLESRDISHRWPEFLPGGKALLYAASANTSSWANAQVVVQPLGKNERRNLIQGGTNPRYAPSGHLLYSQGGSLMAVPFDPQRLAVTGPPVPALERVQQSTISGVAQYSFSSTGSVVYISGGIQSAQSRIVWVSRNGAVQPLAAPVRPYRGPRLSPDGRRVAVAIEEQESQTWLYDLSRETLTRLTFAGSANYNSVWTPDGKRLVFNSNKEGPLNLFWQLADGSGELERITTSQYTEAPMSWSPDGQVLAFIEINPTTGRHIWTLRMGDPSLSPGQIRRQEMFGQTLFTESAPRFSPDGRWLAYVSDESGRFEIYVQPFPGPGGKLQISTEGGTEPVWNLNGRELFYRSGDKMMAVNVATKPGFSAGKPRMLFEGKYEPAPATFPNYDVSADGQRFLMLKLVEQAEEAPTQINVVQNWFEELKRRAPAKQ